MEKSELILRRLEDVLSQLKELNNHKPPKYLTIKSAATRYDLSEEAVRGLIHRREMPFYKPFSCVGGFSPLYARCPAWRSNRVRILSLNFRHFILSCNFMPYVLRLYNGMIKHFLNDRSAINPYIMVMICMCGI